MAMMPISLHSCQGHRLENTTQYFKLDLIHMEGKHTKHKVIKGNLTPLLLNPCFTLLCCVLASTKSDAAQLEKKTP